MNILKERVLYAVCIIIIKKKKFRLLKSINKVITRHKENSRRN